MAVNGTKETLYAVYAECGEGMRFYADSRYKVLTATVTVTGGILALTKYVGASPYLTGLGVLVSLLLFILELRSAAFWYVYFRRAAQLEKRMNLRGPYTDMAEYKRPWYQIRATTATRILYLLLIGFWLLYTIYLIQAKPAVSPPIAPST